MADTAAPQPTPFQPNPQGPMIQTVAQFLRDLSFENPNAPGSLSPKETGPEVNIQVNVSANPGPDGNQIVDIHLEGSARIGSEVLFAFDVKFGGLFRLVNIPADQLQWVAMVECPRILFPFARQIVADCTRNGGFPPLYVDPIDFAGIFQHNVQQQQLAEVPPVASA